MGTIVVNNQNIKMHFSKIIDSQNILKTKKIIITSKSGKGKTSLLKYLVEQCEVNNIPVIYFDFKILDLTSELDFIDQIIYNLKDYFENLEFQEYNHYINEYYAKSDEIIIKNVKVIQSSIGNIATPNHMASTFIAKATSVFWSDFDNTLGNQKIFLVLDSCEQMSDEICKWLRRFLLRKKMCKNQLYVVIAGSDTMSPLNDTFSHDIKQYCLPDRYELAEWYKFAEQIHILDKNIIERCFNCYKGEPFNMCIALRPLGDFDES